jgi:hypothetical protein
MPDTTRGYPYPADTDPADVPADIQALAEAIDADLTNWFGTNRLKFLGDVDGSKWIAQLGDAALTFYSDNASTASLSGVADITYDGRTYRAKVRLRPDGRLRTADELQSAAHIAANVPAGILGANSALLGYTGAGAGPGIALGAALDGILRRSGPNELETPGALEVGGALTQDGAAVALDADLDAHTADTALDGGPHGFPALTADGMTWVRQGGALVAANIGTQAELDDHADNYGNGAHIPTGGLTNSEVAAAAAIAESKLNLASDTAAGTASRRTLGTGALQAAAGNDARLSDQRVPTNLSVTEGKIADAAATSRKIAPTTGLVTASGNLSLTSSNQDVPGASLSITPAVASVLLVTASFDAQASNSGQFVGLIELDGVQVGTFARHYASTASERATVTALARLVLDAGPHTVKLRGSNLVGTLGTIHAPSTGFSYMLVAQ